MDWQSLRELLDKNERHLRSRKFKVPLRAIIVALLSISIPQTPALFAQTSLSSAKASAKISLTGTWVSIVNEDWRWRMLTPQKGDYTSVPLNEEGRKVADAWDVSTDGSCKAYGVGGLMRMPTRVRIQWESEDVLRMETDSGLQVRHLYFATPPAMQKRSLQGRSVASWEVAVPPGDGWGFGLASPSRPGGALKVVTTDVQEGWLRRNGVPYGENAVITEYYDTFTGPDNSKWFVVTTIVDDPQYLMVPFITSSHFRQELGESKWNPRPCKN